MENTTHLFLAVRFNCNKCHDHPFERWTQDQYYQTAAFFAQVGRKEDPQVQGPESRRHGRRRRDAAGRDHRRPEAGEVKHLRTGQVAKPIFPYRARTDLVPVHRRRGASSWPTGSPPRTTPISPRATSTASGAICSASASSSRSTTSAPAIRRPIPPCSIALTDDFIESGFNVQHMLQDDLQVARLSAVGEDQRLEPRRRDQLFARPRPPSAGRGAVRRHPSGHRLAEPSAGPAAGSAGGAAARFARRRAGRLLRAVRQAGPRERLRVRALADHDARPGAQPGERARSPADAINDPNNRIAKLVATEKDDAKVVEELFLAFLGRLPTKAELQLGLQSLKDGEETYQTAGRRGQAASGRPGRLRENPRRPAAAVGGRRSSTRPADVDAAGHRQGRSPRAARR